MLQNIRRVNESKKEKQQRPAVASYAEVNEIGKDWQTRNKIFQFVRQQQEAEELEASIPAVILEPESGPPTTTQQPPLRKQPPPHSPSNDTARDPALPGARKGVPNRGWNRGRRGGRGGRGHRRDPALYKANTLQD
eukprot:Protomagalhaensia_wolfi_Nauph_80__5667@NODE_661_length_2156_cov_4_303259_g491_i0_p2_GENE_NODE_661_length_2156_cov_4_303259_g491_i0NODE_661_length_2156_cov_4_303259_g491_i0_p2_ORF_typecomplete_len136_score22_22DUF4363/PF14276_6/0_019_NODE_661_length_2156_cov_4_303259_g491_i019426